MVKMNDEGNTKLKIISYRSMTTFLRGLYTQIPGLWSHH